MAKRTSKKSTISPSPNASAIADSQLPVEPIEEQGGVRPRVYVHDVCDDHPDFAFTRYWYDRKEAREGITPWVCKKLRPGDDPTFGAAAKSEILLPASAPSDYMNVHFLTRQFDETLPGFEKHVMVQTKIILDPAEPWHVGYERVRGYAKSHFAGDFPVILIAHIPQIVGLKGNGSHVHCVVLARGITINGFTPACTVLCSDRGYSQALGAWRKHCKAEGKGA